MFTFQGYGAQKLGRYRSIFTPEQEQELAGHCKNLDDSFYGLSLIDLRRAVFQYAEANKITHRFDPESKVAGKEWTLSFMRRYKLSLRTPQQTSLARMMGFNRVQMNKFFDNYSEVISKYGFRPGRTYNMDETGMSTVPNNVPKVVSTSGKKAVGKISSAERGELITAVCAMSAVGDYVPPVLIFRRKRQKPELLNGAPPGTEMFVSDSGYINSDLFFQWIQHFQKHTNATKENPVLLILDNHSTHQSLETVLYCRENGIVLLSIPPHSSHKVQPLDRCFFQALKTKYAEACNHWLVSHPGRVITQYQVAELFGIAYCRCATIEKAVNAFRMCGIVPLNPGVFTDEDFAPSEVTNIDQSSNVNVEPVEPEASTSGCASQIPSPLAAPVDLRDDSSLNHVKKPVKRNTALRKGKQPMINQPDLTLQQTSEHSTLPNPTSANPELESSCASNQRDESSEKIKPLLASLRNVLESLETVYSENCSTSITPTCTNSPDPVSFAEIRPLPKRAEPQQRRKRGQRSEVITSTLPL